MSISLQARLKPYLGYKELVAAITPSQNQIAIYEQAFAQKFGCAYGTMFTHGRSGLYALFKIWGLEQTEIICPAYTCVVVPHAIVLSGNVPVFVDCAENSFNMNYTQLENAITVKTRAIIVTHLFGYPMDVLRIQYMVAHLEQRHGHKIYVIQDVAHSYGAKWNNQLVTTYGDAAIFGCNISKIITSVFGGMITTNSTETQQLLQAFRQKIGRQNKWKPLKRLLYLGAVFVAFHPFVYGFVNLLERKGFLDTFVRYYDEGKIEFPIDWDELPCNLEARVGIVQLQKYDDIIEARLVNAQQWRQQLAHQPIQFMEELPGTTYSHCVGLVKEREIWLEKYRQEGIQLGILIEYCIPYMKAYRPYTKGQEFPISKAYSNHTINFPVHKSFLFKTK